MWHGWSSIQTGWWFGTFFIFHNIWDVNLPSDFHIFQRARYNHQPAEKIGSKQILMKAFLVWDDVNAQTNTMFSPWHQWHPWVSLQRLAVAIFAAIGHYFQMVWLVVWNMNFIFLYIRNNHPNWLSYFFRGVGIPPIRGLSVYNIQQEIPVYPTKDWTLRLEIKVKVFASPAQTVSSFPKIQHEGRYTRHHFNQNKKGVGYVICINTLILISQAAFLSTSLFYFCLPDQGVGRGLFGELLDRSIEPQKLLSDALRDARGKRATSRWSWRGPKVP
jgi:hypothetical protein